MGLKLVCEGGQIYYARHPSESGARPAHPGGFNNFGETAVALLRFVSPPADLAGVSRVLRVLGALLFLGGGFLVAPLELAALGLTPSLALAVEFDYSDRFAWDSFSGGWEWREGFAR